MGLFSGKCRNPLQGRSKQSFSSYGITTRNELSLCRMSVTNFKVEFYVLLTDSYWYLFKVGYDLAQPALVTFKTLNSLSINTREPIIQCLASSWLHESLVKTVQHKQTLNDYIFPNKYVIVNLKVVYVCGRS